MMTTGTRRALLQSGGIRSAYDIPGLVAYFNADRDLTALADSAAIPAWLEPVSGNSADQAGPTLQPLLKKGLAEFGGRDAALLDGSNDVLVDTTPTNMALGVLFTFVVVFKITTSGLTQDFLTAGASTGGRSFRLTTGTNLLSLVKPGTGACSSNTAFTDTVGAHVAVVTYDGANARFWMDGVADGTPAFGTTFTDGDFVIGGRNSTPAEPFKGHIASLLVYNRTLTPTVQVPALSRILGNYYRIPVA